MRFVQALAAVLGVAACAAASAGRPTPSDAELRAAFRRQGIRLTARGGRGDPRRRRAGPRRGARARDREQQGRLRRGRDREPTWASTPSPGSNTVTQRGRWPHLRDAARRRRSPARRPSAASAAAARVGRATSSETREPLERAPTSCSSCASKGFHPVKISWEDIGRHQNSVWGDRISDVGIWVRQREARSAKRAPRALRAPRQQLPRQGAGGAGLARSRSTSGSANARSRRRCRERLRRARSDAAATRDRNVIVSNQFAIVPVPARSMRGAWPERRAAARGLHLQHLPVRLDQLRHHRRDRGQPRGDRRPRASTSCCSPTSTARRAPFTASRAEDRQDLLKLERELKAQGMDVDVQRYYLIQVPLRRDVRGIQLSNMGTPPWRRAFAVAVATRAASRRAGGVRTRRRRGAARRRPSAPAAAAGRGQAAAESATPAAGRSRAWRAWRSATARSRGRTTRAPASAARARRSRSA